MADGPIRLGFDLGSVNVKGYLIDESARHKSSDQRWCRPCRGKPLEMTLEILAEAQRVQLDTLFHQVHQHFEERKRHL